MSSVGAVFGIRRPGSLITLGTLSLCALLIFAKTMTAPVNVNEHMYVAASVAILSQHLYRDFPFLQAPLLPLVLGLAYRLSGTTYYLLVGRLLAACAAVLAMLLLYRVVARQQARSSSAIALMGALLFVFNCHVATTIQEASSNVLALPLSLLAFGLLLSNRPRSATLAGVFAGLSVAAKLYYLALVPAALVYLLLRERRRVVPFSAGVVLGCAPLLWYAAACWPEFHFCNYAYHVAKTSLALANTPAIDRLVSAFAALPMLLLYLAALGCLLAVQVEARLSRTLETSRRWSVTVNDAAPWIFLAFGVATVISIRAINSQYLAMVVPWLILAIAAMALRARAARLVMAAAVMLSAVPALSGRSFSFADGYLTGLRSFARPSSWTGVEIHRQAGELRARLQSIGVSSGRVATLAPIFALEAGFSIYPQLTSGVFPYDAADSFSATIRTRFHVVSESDLGSLFEKEPAVAVLRGFVAPYDDRFAARARGPGIIALARREIEPR